MIYGYASVNIYDKNLEDKLNEQIGMLFCNGCTKVIEEKYVLKEPRIRLNELKINLVEGDILVVTKLDRISHNLNCAYKFILELIKRKIGIIILNIGLIDYKKESEPILKAITSILQFNKTIKMEKIQTGKALARNLPNYKEGRPKKYNNEKIQEALKLLSVNGGKYSYNETEKITGISKSTLLRENKKQTRTF
ncbi:recombinase family protein [Hathewaya limosa]|uniref:DNA invertase Pin-like site-specific DNA recombinase n=1 Tax=Hathewaya limosa TaxID=1536 RepID=A0ABU0JX04_HATLI|nr:recombinase family protein [Hathewaya limosa]MDQ0480698.1 DNA invertase Pin-like site-specific DNA recombinase [Hathewaya limosa]